ncbi:hypothetical protein MYP_529 [Sporocytophaga myxococcoides]|uniref:Uncharacterized protein n=1 Tax=Sporocytophaga myxococcoides TaxID=153721 RepID=A0A098LAX0_9BACT|nr:hypothetical protein [Sporocytophaga myxococcoides]GAL83303.1 hypothetical protein MYP_529 [Sporocytophaga myxococcoides]
MGKFKINKNKPRPSDDKIASHQNFDQLIKNYNQLTDYKKAVRPLYQDKKFLGFILIILIVFLAIWISENEGNSSESPLKKQNQEKDR